MTAHETLPRRTPLYKTHRRLGAAMTDFAGWAMPLRYGSETAGPQAAAALNYALVSDIAAIPVCCRRPADPGP
jgi:aminomethyltransferase